MQERAPELGSAFSFAGRVALISGGGRGIGAGISKRFAEAGAAVVVGYARAEAAAQEVVEQIQAAGGKAQAVRADVSRTDDVDRLISQTLERFGRLDVLVNNAGAYILLRLYWRWPTTNGSRCWRSI